MHWCLWFLINTVVQPPQQLVLRNQQVIAVAGAIQIDGSLVHFRNGDGPHLSLRVGLVDWPRTLQPDPQPEQLKKPKPIDRHAIDWNHPAMRHKQFSLRSIAIDDLGLREFMRGQKRPTTANAEQRASCGAASASEEPN